MSGSLVPTDPTTWPYGYVPPVEVWHEVFANIVRTAGTSVTSGNFAAFTDATGLVLGDSGVTAEAVAASLPVILGAVSTIAALRASTSATLPRAQCYVLGYATLADGGEGTFTYRSSDTTSADNGGTIIVDASGRRWARSLNAASVSVHHFGATVNTGTDAAAAINAAITFVSQAEGIFAGGGVVTFEAGEYTIASTIVMKTRVILEGKGHGQTVILGATGTTMDLVQTYQFSSLTGTNTVGGPYMFGLRGVSLDGQGRAGGRCIAIYGYDYVLEDCQFQGAHGDGIYSEWSTSGGVPVASGGNGMEARIANCKVFLNGGNGITFNGPHDSDIINVLVFLNTGYGIAANQTANYAGGCNLITVHAYANSNHGIYVNCGVNMSQVQSESNQGAAGGYLIDTAGFVVGSDITAYSNGGFGMQVNGGLSTMSNLFFHANGTNGLALIGSGNQFSNVLSNNNGQDGIVATSTGTSTIINGALVQSNGSFGIALSGSDMSVTGILAEFNTGGGVALANGIGSIRLQGEVNNNGTGAVQVPLGTMGVGCMIDLVVFTEAEQTAWTGSLGTNFVRIAVSGAGTSTISNVPGVTNASAAAAGTVGEVATVQGNGVGMTSGSAINITSIGLTPGDWDVTGLGLAAPTGATVTNFAATISAASGTLGPFPQGVISGVTTTGQTSLTLPTTRMNVAAFTTIYLVSEVNFTGGTVSCAGYLYARRAR